MSTHSQLLDNLHLWLHREGGDAELEQACRRFDWGSLDSITLTLPEANALRTLAAWYAGERTDLIGDAEDFHEAQTDAQCLAVDEMVVRLDGRVSGGNADRYEADNVIPLRRR